jgi:CRP-like cAMP-binding protein
MAPVSESAIHQNRLLRSLSAGDLALLEPHLEPVELEVRADMEKPHKPIRHAFFIQAGIASVVARSSNGEKVEVGIIGREGMTGLMVVMGNDRSPNETYVQVAGDALRIRSDDLRGAMEASPTMRIDLLQYAQAFMIQTAHTALANGRAALEQRLARWLLMAHDRLDGDELPLVHDFLALMLGVRRAGVTVAVNELESQGLIEGKRGSITVMDREGLEQVADGIYGTPEAEYERLMKR